MLYPVLAMTTHQTSNGQVVLAVDDDTVIADTLTEILKHAALKHAGFAAYARMSDNVAVCPTFPYWRTRIGQSCDHVCRFDYSRW